MRRLAIVGSHPDSRDIIPWDDDIEIWVFNEAAHAKDWVKRWDAVIQIHGEEVYTSPTNFVSKDHWEWLQRDHGEGKTIWMQHADPRVPNSKAYPLDEVLEMAGRRYVRSSIAYALALGIYLEYDEIQLYGINLVSNTEYRYQAVNMAWWIGFAEGRGVNLRLMCWHDEFVNQRLYGFDGEIRLEKEYFVKRAAELLPNADSNQKTLRRLRSKLEEALEKFDFQKVASLMVEMESVSIMAGEAAGMLDVAQKYAARDETDAIPRQEFERRSAEAQRDGPGIKAQMYHEGGKAEYVWNVWAQTGNAEARAQLRTFCTNKLEFAYKAGWLHGVFQENYKYMEDLDDRITAAGGVRTMIALGVK